MMTLVSKTRHIVFCCFFFFGLFYKFVCIFHSPGEFLSLMYVMALSVGSKKDRQGCEVLTLMLQALQSIVTSEALPAARVLVRPQSEL